MIQNLLLSLLSLIPIAIWLGLFLWRDAKRPEPWYWILIVFVAGILITPIVLLFENYYVTGVNTLVSNQPTNDYFLFFGIAFIEEVAKFLVVYLLMKLNRHFDEAIDAMIYMIIAALGFASVENIIVVSKELALSPYMSSAFQILGFRFIGANLIHILCSGFIGFFWALRLAQRNMKYYPIGLTIGILLHTAFNIVIMKLGYDVLFIVSTVLFIFALFIIWAFNILEYAKWKPGKET